MFRKPSPTRRRGRGAGSCNGTRNRSGPVPGRGHVGQDVEGRRSAAGGAHQRRRALAGVGSNEAVAALKEVLLTGPDELRAAIAEALGNCPHPESLSILLGLCGTEVRPSFAPQCAVWRGKINAGAGSIEPVAVRLDEASECSL